MRASVARPRERDRDLGRIHDRGSDAQQPAASLGEAQDGAAEGSLAVREDDKAHGDGARDGEEQEAGHATYQAGDASGNPETGGHEDPQGAAVTAPEGVQKGVARSWNDLKGFGFISPESGGDDIFVHHSAISGDGYRCLTEGEPVEYTVIVSDDGRLKAANVTGPDRGRLRGIWGDEQPICGVVVKWRSDKGFGFIKPEDGQNDIFVHQSTIVSTGFRELSEGDEVEFTTQMDGGRVKAKKVTGRGGKPLPGADRDALAGGGRGGGPRGPDPMRGGGGYGGAPPRGPMGPGGGGYGAPGGGGGYGGGGYGGPAGGGPTGGGGGGYPPYSYNSAGPMGGGYGGAPAGGYGGGGYGGGMGMGVPPPMGGMGGGQPPGMMGRMGYQGYPPEGGAGGPDRRNLGMGGQRYNPYGRGAGPPAGGYGGYGYGGGYGGR
mmetsp:Transcript_13689/g.36652  ORF Transcript_13689/g.36652 Transcript_13689/m.36652 type:complete len:433 (-) Transcript_13689:448-1746(-)